MGCFQGWDQDQDCNQQQIRNTKIQMTTPTKNQQSESLALWKVKLELAAQGSYQAIQQVKQHILQQTDEAHPIFKQSFYDILQQGYELHFVDGRGKFGKVYEMFREFPLFFLVQGAVQVRCINLEGDTDVVASTKGKGLLAVEAPALQKKYGAQNLNLLTKFQIHALEPSILLQIHNSSKSEQALQRKEITQKQNNIMRRYMIFPSKEIVRVTVNPGNQDHIKDRAYLLAGKACFYLDDETVCGRRLLLACYEEGYLNPKQFGAVQESTNSIPSSFNIQQKPKTETLPKPLPIKLHIFEHSQIFYLQQNFLKDDLIKAIEQKRQAHLFQIIQKYKQMTPQAIEAAQNQLMMRFKLNKKEINTQIYKLVEAKGMKDKGFMTAKEMIGDRKLKTRTDLISTSSSMKCSIRIRKSKKIV